MAQIVAGLSEAGRLVAAIGVLMALLWLTEALPVAATALVPIGLVPLLSGGDVSIRSVAAPYAHELIYLYMGGFMLALAMQRWNLHRRLALRVVLFFGERASGIVLGFMLATAGLSMWISNTATVVMMLPIVLSVIELVRTRLREDAASANVLQEGRPFHFALCLLLGMAYAASIGGTATLIGTPPNTFLTGFLRDAYGRDIGFAQWLPLGLSLVVVLLPLTWLLLTRVLYPLELRRLPGGREVVRRELNLQGPMTLQEKQVLLVFCTTASLWMLRKPIASIQIGEAQPFSGLTDPGIALLASLVLFAWPVDLRRGVFLLDWQRARELPWGILLLFGGGLSLAQLVRDTGVDQFIGSSLSGLGGLPTWLVIAFVTASVVFLTEVTSNTATTATFLPVLAATAEGLDLDPMRVLVPVTLAASCAFMMPVATPPNAIVFGSGEISIPQMARAGIVLNVLALITILVLTSFIQVG